MNTVVKLKIGTKLELNEEDQKSCRQLAEKRYSNNRASNVRNQKIGKQSNEFTDLQGIGGEFAFSRMVMEQPDRSIHPRSSSNDSGDLVLANGTTIDVKTTHYETGKLLVVPWKVKKVDYYVLMTGVFPEFTYKGAIKSDDMLLEQRLGSVGYGDTYIAKQTELEALI